MGKAVWMPRAMMRNSFIYWNLATLPDHTTSRDTTAIAALERHLPTHAVFADRRSLFPVIWPA